MKKLLNVLLAIISIFLICACSQPANSEKGEYSTNVQAKQSKAQVAEKTVHYCYVCGDTEVKSSDDICASCKCGLCNYPKIDASLYCENHKCLMCNNSKTVSAYYCSRHKCKASGCEEFNSGNSYCVKHACVIKGCINQKHASSQYCYSHMVSYS